MAVIRIEDYARVSVIVFDRPGSPHNLAWIWRWWPNFTKLFAAWRLMRRLEALSSRRQKILCGRGDLNELKALNTPEEAAPEYQMVQSCLRILNWCPKPCVAAINGLALGGGPEVALALQLLHRGRRSAPKTGPAVEVFL